MIKSLSKKAKKVINEGLQEFMNGFSSLAEAVRIGGRMMLQSAVEEEVTAFLGRDYYEKGNGRGMRNGYKPKAVKIGISEVTIKMPQVRGTDKPFHSKILPPLALVKKIVSTPQTYC